MKSILKAVAVTTLPRIVHDIYDTVVEYFSDDEKTKTVKRKKHDTTKFTQWIYDYILFEYNEFLLYNEQHPKNKRTVKYLTKKLNKKMGLNKSTTSYARVWNGHLDRNTLAKGQKLFTWEG